MVASHVEPTVVTTLHCPPKAGEFLLTSGPVFVLLGGVAGAIMGICIQLRHDGLVLLSGFGSGFHDL